MIPRHLAITLGTLLAALVLLSSPTRAQVVNDETNRTWTDAERAALAKGSHEPIPVGTVITTSNWQNYKDHMSFGSQLFFRGTHLMKFPAGDSNYEWVVHPTDVKPMPSAWVEASEKYKNQAELTPGEGGGFYFKNYTTGQPFQIPALPDPQQDPNLGVKIAYNVYFSYVPHNQLTRTLQWFVDRYGNMTHQVATTYAFRTNHNADPQFPLSDPHAQDMFRLQNSSVVWPEQSKYTTALIRTPEDPASPIDQFAFVPALRRVLRLSGAAQCSPALGGDKYREDSTSTGISFHVPWYSFKFLGDKNFLGITNANGVDYVNDKNMLLDPAEIAKSHIVWPNKKLQQWENRDVYVVEARNLPAFQNQACYGARVFYIDKHNFIAMFIDFFDKEMKYWKGQFYSQALQPAPPPQTGSFFGANSDYEMTVDFQNEHQSNNLTYLNCNDEVCGDGQDPDKHATPAALQKVMQ